MQKSKVYIAADTSLGDRYEDGDGEKAAELREGQRCRKPQCEAGKSRLP